MTIWVCGPGDTPAAVLTKGPGHVGKPRTIWNDVVLSDIHHLSMSRPYQVAQNKSAWRAQTCFTRT